MSNYEAKMSIDVGQIKQEIADFKCNEPSAEFYQHTCLQLIKALEESEPFAKKWWQIYQDRCEGAYVEATIAKELRTENESLRRRLREAEKTIAELQRVQNATALNAAVGKSSS